MIKDNINLNTGEVITTKPYETEDHLSIKTEISKQIKYVNGTLKDEKGQLARLDGDTLSLVLLELVAYYQYLTAWLADEKLHLADMRTAIELKFAQRYCDLKATKGETNETSRMKSKIYCSKDEDEYNLYRHGYDVIDAWKKSIGRYHDSVRSQLSWEKQIGGMSKGL